MLQNIRDKTSGWIATIILGMFAMGMLFFGIQDYLIPKVETYAARVESAPRFWIFGKKTRDISVDDFRRRFERARQDQRQQQGEAFDPNAFESVENKRLVLDRLIDEAVLELVAEREGLVVSRAQIQKAIAEIPSFQVAGKFDKGQYLLALQTQNQTPEQFQQLVKTSLLQQLLPVEISESALLGDSELDSFIRMSQQTRKVRFLEVPAPVEPVAAPNETEIKAWYDAHKATYRTQETVTAEYIELDAASLPAPAAADEATLLKTYKENQSRFGTPEQRLVSHILVQVDPKAPAGAWSAAEAKAKAIAARAKAPGADFAAIARETSEDIGTKDSGGELGAISDLAPSADDPLRAAFEKATANLQPGQVSDPVRSPSGWHVIQLREVVPGSVKPFEEVRAQLESEALDAERQRLFADASGELSEAVYATPSSLADVAAKVKLPVNKAGTFDAAHGEGIAALPAVRKAAFEDDQKLERQVSDPIEISPDHVVVLQVTDHHDAAEQPLKDVHDRVVNDIIADKVAKATQARAEALLKRLRAGEALDALAAEIGQPVRDVPAMNRQPPSPSLAPLVDGVFALPRPAGKPETTLAKMTTGEYVLAEVQSVTDGDPAALEANLRDQLRQQISQARGVEDARAYIQALRKQYTIKVAEDRL
jgi:peptidyl-prolyl cis-trans isomerase D